MDPEVAKPIWGRPQGGSNQIVDSLEPQVLELGSAQPGQLATRPARPHQIPARIMFSMVFYGF